MMNDEIDDSVIERARFLEQEADQLIADDKETTRDAIRRLSLMIAQLESESGFKCDS